MSTLRQHALVDASVEEIWQLVGDIERYPDWWPAVVEVQGETFEEGAEFVQISRPPIGRGTVETRFVVDRRDELREIRMHCTLSGTYAHWQLTEARGGTFVEIEGGMDPTTMRYRMLDTVAGRLIYRRWVDAAINALVQAATRDAGASG